MATREQVRRLPPSRFKEILEKDIRKREAQLRKLPPSEFKEILRRGGGNGRISEDVIKRLEAEEKAKQEAQRKAEEKAKQEAQKKAEEKARQEAQRKARQDALERQRELARLQKEKLAKEKAQAESLRKMSISQRKEFFISQAELQKAQSFQRLKDRGKRLTASSDKLLSAVKEKIESQLPKEVIIQRQIDTVKGIPILETIVRDEKTGKERKPTKEEFELINRYTKTVLPAKTNKEIFSQIKKIYTPTFFGSSPIAIKVQNVIGGALASGVYAEKELGKRLFNLRDARGQRIFNETQAINSGKLISEIVKGFATGLATGKALKILKISAKALGKIKVIKGVKPFEKFVSPSVAQLFPKTLTGTEKQILSRTAQIGLISGLTIFETKRVINTARTEGKKSALLQLIGLTAFIGGIKIGAKDFKILKPKQKELIRKQFKNLKTNFIKTADEETLRLLKRYKINNKPVFDKADLQLKRLKKLKDIGVKPRIEKITYRKLTPIEKNNLIRKTSKKLVRQLEKKFNKILTREERLKLEKGFRKVIRNKLNAGKPLLKLEREIIQGKKSYLQRLINELKQFKGVKRIRKIKRISKKISKKIEAKKRKARKTREEIAKELKKFKGIKRYRKIKKRLKKLKGESLIKSKNIRKYYNLKIRQLKDIGAVREERFFFQELSSNEKNRLIKDSAENLLRRLERKFNKKITAPHLRDKINNELRKVIRNRLDKGGSLLKTESEIITLKKPYLSRIKNIIKEIKKPVISKIKKIRIKKRPYKITSKLKDLSFIEKKALRENLKNKLIRLYNKKYGKLVPEEQKLLEKKVNDYVNLNTNLNKKVSVVESRLIDPRLSTKILKAVRKIKRIPKKLKKKILPKKIKVREVIRLDQLAFKARQEQINLLSKRIARALEKRSGIKLGTHKREELIKGIRKEISKRSHSKIELRKFKDQIQRLLKAKKADVLKIKVIKEKPRIPKKKIKPTKPDKRKPLFKVTKIEEPRIRREVRDITSRQQQLLLEPKVKTKIREKVKVFEILDPNSKQFKILQKSSKVKHRQLQQMRIKDRSLQRQKLKMETQIKVIQRDLIQIKLIPRMKIKQKQLIQQGILIKQLSKIRSAIKILSKSIIKSASLIKSLSKELFLIDSRIKTSLKAKQKLITAQKARPVIPFPKIKAKVKKKVVKKKDIPYDVYARPLKKKGQKKIPRLIKVNKKPLSKSRAEDLRNYLVDHSLARTAKIKTTTGKIEDLSINIPKSFASKTKGKFRKVRIVKGKRKGLPSGMVIEKTKNILDTRSEKKGITLKRLVSQVKQKPKVRVKKKVKRKSPHRITKKPKRTLSQAQINALKKGRKKRLDKFKKKK